jgi:hypothetical protein
VKSEFASVYLFAATSAYEIKSLMLLTSESISFIDYYDFLNYSDSRYNSSMEWSVFLTVELMNVFTISFS